MYVFSDMSESSLNEGRTEPTAQRHCLKIPRLTDRGTGIIMCVCVLVGGSYKLETIPGIQEHFRMKKNSCFKYFITFPRSHASLSIHQFTLFSDVFPSKLQMSVHFTQCNSECLFMRVQSLCTLL